jgi:hypothetical protein
VGVIRPCHKGREIGPVMADDRATAEVVLSPLLASAGGGEIILDIPCPNRDAVALAQELGARASVRDCADVYRRHPAAAAGAVFGVTTFELGSAREQWTCSLHPLKQKLIGWLKKAGMFPKSGLISRSFFFVRTAFV